jgi:hypothetical protein
MLIAFQNVILKRMDYGENNVPRTALDFIRFDKARLEGKCFAAHRRLLA